MRKRYYLLILFAILSALPVSAQDTCRVVTIPNPHGAAMTISRVFIADTVNFSVEPLRAVPFNIGASETWDARVCIKARDGQSHSTTIRYQTTHGQASFPVTMTAPGTAGIAETAAPRKVLAFPQPTSGRVTVGLEEAVVGELRARVYDHAGGLATTLSSLSSANDEVTLDLTGLSTGAYTIVLDAAGHVIAQSSVLIVH